MPDPRANGLLPAPFLQDLLLHVLFVCVVTVVAPLPPRVALSEVAPRVELRVHKEHFGLVPQPVHAFWVTRAWLPLLVLPAQVQS